MQEIYKFNKNDYDADGRNKSNGKLILDFINDCEKDFHKNFPPLYANNLFANSSTMKLINDSYFDCENETCGVDGEYDSDANNEIEKFAKNKTVYAISSAEDMDEPLFLTRDQTISDGIFILKYLPDNDDENIEPEIPIEEDKIKNKVVLTPKN